MEMFHINVLKIKKKIWNVFIFFIFFWVLLSGTTVGATNTASVISTTPLVTTATSSPSLSPSPTIIQSTSTDSKAGIQSQTIMTQAATSVPSTLGTGQVMVTAQGLSAALQGAAQLPTSASFAAMAAAAAGLNPGLMASSQFAPGSVWATFTGCVYRPRSLPVDSNICICVQGRSS